jgi:hypothetical protein
LGGDCVEQLRQLTRLFVLNAFEGVEAVFEGVENPQARDVPHFVVYQKKAAFGQFDVSCEPDVELVHMGEQRGKWSLVLCARMLGGARR